MNNNFQRIAIALALVIATGCAAQAATDSLTSAGYTQNFDSMGTTGTSLPDQGWSVYSVAGANSSWETSIPGSDLGGGNGFTQTQATVGTTLLDSAITSSTKSATFYNIADSATPTNRALGTSPTGIAGMVLQLSLTNNTGSAINTFNISYDINKYSDGYLQGPTAGLPNNEELPGYQLFYSVNGGAFTNVAALNPVASNVANPNNQPVIPVGTPNTPGADYTVTHVNGTVTLAQAVAAGQTLTLNWVDDNAVNLSPDQVIGLDNVNVTPTPIPAAAWLLGSGLLSLMGFRKKSNC